MNQPRGRERETPQDPPGSFDSPSDSHYGIESSTSDVRPRRRIMHRDNLKDLSIEALEFDGSLKPKDYLEYVQAMERIIEINGFSRKRHLNLLF